MDARSRIDHERHGEPDGGAASLQKSLHKPDFLKIEETQGHFVVYCVKPCLPHKSLISKVLERATRIELA